MQGDMTWVQEDMGVVHEVMEKIAEHVSGFKKIANEEDGPREDVDLGGSHGAHGEMQAKNQSMPRPEQQAWIK